MNKLLFVILALGVITIFSSVGAQAQGVWHDAEEIKAGTFGQLVGEGPSSNWIFEGNVQIGNGLQISSGVLDIDGDILVTGTINDIDISTLDDSVTNEIQDLTVAFGTIGLTQSVNEVTCADITGGGGLCDGTDDVGIGDCDGVSGCVDNAFCQAITGYDCTSLPSFTDTNASTICDSGEYLDGDGNCNIISVTDVWVDTAGDTMTGNLNINNNRGIYLAGNTLGSDAARLYTTSASDRLFVRSEDTNNVAQFASYGLYLPQDPGISLYTGGDIRIGYASGSDDDTIYFDSASEYLRWDESPGEFDLSDDLSVSGAITATGDVCTSGGNCLSDVGNGGSSLWTPSGSNIYYNTGGNVGIGTTTIPEKLTVDGNVMATAFLYSSDYSLKKDITTLDNSLEKILKLRGVSFNWKEDGQPSIGLIAQEVEKVYPELVTGEDGSKSVQYGNLVASLIEAVKEQQKEIGQLEARIKILEKME